MAIRMNPSTEDLRRAVLALETSTRTVGEFTLDPNSTTTVVSAFQVAPTSVVVPVPTNAASAQEYAAGTMWITVGRNDFTVTHSNSAVANRTFKFTVTI